ncbi:MAG: hypothetical protein ABIZ91_11460 [Gemmatimonadaceae bacterium]
MFDDLREAFRDLLSGNVAPEARRGLLHEMRETLVRAKLAIDDLHAGVETTRARVATERQELETVRRRRTLAEQIQDAETVAVAARFEATHSERLQLLERKLEVAEGELALVERDVEEMKTQYKAASAGVGSGLSEGGAGSVPLSDGELGLDDRGAGLAEELGSMDRARRRAASEAEAEARLAELKRRMGR